MSTIKSDILLSLWDVLFPGPSLSPDAENQIRLLINMSDDAIERDQHFYQQILDIVIEDQSKQGLRLHKGFPLYWLARATGSENREQALNFMLEAFVEDVLTHGQESLSGFAAISLKNDFGLKIETLVALREFITSKMRAVFYPSSLVKGFVGEKGQLHAIDNFQGVTSVSVTESVSAQALKELQNDLRRSMNHTPGSEVELQSVISALLLRVDPTTERERTLQGISGKESRIDFVMKLGNVGVEVKLIKDKGQLGLTIEQVTADIVSYTQSFSKVIFVVYDACGAIDDVNQFAAGLKKQSPRVEVLIIKH